MKLVLPALLALGCSACSLAEGSDGSPTSETGVSGTLFVANKRGASLSRLDLATGDETHRAETCENPHELAISPDNAQVLVACYSGRALEAYATADLSPTFTVELGEDSRVHSAVWHNDGVVVAGAEGRGSLYKVEIMPEDGTFQLTETGMGGAGPHMVVVNAEGSYAWGTIIPSGTVVRYDLANGVEAVRRVVGDQTEALALSPDGSSLWVGSNTESRVYRLDPETLQTLATIPVGEVPIRIAIHPSGEFVVTSNFGTGDLSVIDTATDEVVRTIPVSGRRDAVQVTLAFSPDGQRLYAAETQDDRIAEIDFTTGEVLRRLPTGPGGDGLAVTD